MAGLGTKAIKNRIKSMQSTRQITKAMELVAASKLRGAQIRAVSGRPYFTELYAAMNDIADDSPDFASPYLKAKQGGKPVMVVIAGDRGLAGGYNNNILKLCYQKAAAEDAVVVPIGKKAMEFFRRHGSVILSEEYPVTGEVSVGDCYTIANLLAEGFLAGRYNKVTVGYTNFASMLSQTPSTLDLLPLTVSDQKTKRRNEICYEGGSEAVFNAIVPEYLGGVLYGALCESVASEHAARRTAMDAASKNASEIIDDLNLKFNRARQGAITQEITEIVAGSGQN